jgi:Domain of unknown function (DUF3387)
VIVKAKIPVESVRAFAIAPVDWAIKESVQATLRRNIRRILRRHGYPPDLQEKAVQTIIDQAKLFAEDLLPEIIPEAGDPLPGTGSNSLSWRSLKRVEAFSNRALTWSLSSPL